MKVRLDMDKIARGLGAERRGKVTTSGGYFGAIQLLADIEARFRIKGRVRDYGFRLRGMSARTRSSRR